MSRRGFLWTVAALAGAAIAALLGWRWRLLRHLAFPPRDAAVAPSSPRDPFVRGGRARVVLVTGGDPAGRALACLERLGAGEALDLAGRKVLVKPNVVAGLPSPTTTHPEAVEAVCRWLRDRGAAAVWVGDLSAVMTRGTRPSMRAAGIDEAARRAGAVPVFFEEHGWVPVRLPGAGFLEEVPVSELLRRADRIVNLPVIKTHRWAGYSACLKNFVGATHPRYRPYMIDSEHWEEIVAELNLAYRPDLNLLDGTRVLVAGGPRHGETAELGVALAGGDRIACDAVALALLKTFDAHPPLRGRGVWEQTQIAHARRLGLGIGGPGELDLEIHHLDPPSPELEGRLERMRALLAA